jgi:predicted nucleic acid-binding protein
MSRFVVDASVAIKWFVPEIHSAEAIRLLSPDCELLAPDLLPSEFGNILWKKTRRGEIPSPKAVEIIRALAEIPLYYSSAPELLESAYLLAEKFERTVYDSLYLSLALLEGCPMVTADLRLVRSLAGTSLARSLFWVEDLK